MDDRRDDHGGEPGSALDHDRGEQAEQRQGSQQSDEGDEQEGDDQGDRHHLQLPHPLRRRPTEDVDVTVRLGVRVGDLHRPGLDERVGSHRLGDLGQAVVVPSPVPGQGAHEQHGRDHRDQPAEDGGEEAGPDPVPLVEDGIVERVDERVAADRGEEAVRDGLLDRDPACCSRAHSPMTSVSCGVVLLEVGGEVVAGGGVGLEEVVLDVGVVLVGLDGPLHLLDPVVAWPSR